MEIFQSNNLSINSEGLLCINDIVVDPDMILFEEDAKVLLENELMEVPLFYNPDDENDLAPSDMDEFEIISDDESTFDDEISLDGNNQDLFSEDSE
jgi:hypothetical protein